MELETRKRNDTSFEKIVEELATEHSQNKRNRDRSVRRWATFGHKYELRKEGEAHTLYLDVIGLGEKCWGKKDTDEVAYVCQVCKQESGHDIYGEECKSCNSKNVTCVPKRSRRKTIEGFSKSRRLTAMIESTFGLILSEHNPREILSMGGDEMIAKIDPDSWGRIVDDVEKHCQKLHGAFMGEIEPEPIWWAMNLPPGIEPDQITSSVKDSLRTVNMDWGVRFVQPMFTRLTTISDG